MTPKRIKQLVAGGAVLLLVIVLPLIANILGIRRHLQYLRTMHRIETLADSLHRYRDATGGYPRTQRATELVQTLGIRNYAQLADDAWDHEFRYESKACGGCGFFLASAGPDNATLRSDLAAYEPAEVRGSHTILVCNDKGWVVYPFGTLDGGKAVVPIDSNTGKPVDLR